jgi:hypothetical protein
MKKAIIALILIAAASAGFWLYRCGDLLGGSEPTQCELCARPIPKATAFGVAREAHLLWCCCPRCGLSLVAPGKDGTSGAQATDYETGRIVPADQAIYVRGADLAPCCSPNIVVTDSKVHLEKCFDRCYPSVIAFARPESALAFVKQHGGEMLKFDTLLSESRP